MVLQALAAADVRGSRCVYETFRPLVPYPVLSALEHSGSGVFFIPVAVILSVLPIAARDVRVVATNFAAGFLVDILAVGALKLLTRRPRPLYAHHRYKAAVAPDQFSFPSGHASRCVFVACMAIAIRDLITPLFATLVLAWALATAFSRVLLARHYLLDVITGAVLGIINAHIFTQGQYDASMLLLHGSTLSASGSSSRSPPSSTPS